MPFAVLQQRQMSRAECLETFLFRSGLSPSSLTNLGRGFNVGVPPLSGIISLGRVASSLVMCGDVYHL